MLRRVTLVCTDVSEERIALIALTRFGGVGTTLAVTRNHSTLRRNTCSMILFNLIMEAIRSSEKSILTRATWRHVPEDGIHHSHRRENLKSYIALTGWAL
jgi:hypothetical protein